MRTKRVLGVSLALAMLLGMVPGMVQTALADDDADTYGMTIRLTIAQQYKLTYDGNGAEEGSVPAEPTPYDEGTEVTVLGNPGNLAKGDLTFAGWNTKADGTGAAYKAGDTLALAADTTLYAQWKASVSRTVIFKVANGSWDDGSTQAKEVTLTGLEGDELKLSADQIPAVGGKPAEGYEAGGWDVTPSTGTAITADTTYTYTYAKKEAPKTATLTFDLGGGTLDGKTGTLTVVANVGDTIKLPGAPTRSGYTFQYWKGSQYGAGADYKVEGDHSFTAVWEKKASGNKASTNKGGTTKKANNSGKAALAKTGDPSSASLAPLAVGAGVALVAAGAVLARRRRG